MEFIFEAQNTPFLVALVLMVAIGLLEGVGLLIGAGFSQFFDSFVPDFGTDLDFDLDVDADIGADADLGAFSRLLGWMHFGRVPFLILMVVFLTSFGLSGLLLQYSLSSTVGISLPAFAAAIAATLVTFPVVRVVGHGLQRLIPKDETQAVSQDTLIGRVAVVVSGIAKTGEPTQAKVRDRHRHTHYIMVEPDGDQDSFAQGDSVILVKRLGATFRAIRNTNPNLVDQGRN